MTTSQEEHVSAPWVPDDSAFGARLALVRQRMGWGNLKEAAVECGLPAESWRQWERDGVMPRRMVEVAQVIAGRTGCDFMWLLTGAASPRKDAVATGEYRPLAARVLTRPPSRPRSAARDSRRPAVTTAAMRRLAA